MRFAHEKSFSRNGSLSGAALAGRASSHWPRMLATSFNASCPATCGPGSRNECSSNPTMKASTAASTPMSASSSIRLPGSCRHRAEGGVATADPIVVRTAVDPISQGFLEIVDASSGNRVVTVIEFVSPSNKVPGEGRDSTSANK